MRHRSHDLQIHKTGKAALAHQCAAFRVIQSEDQGKVACLIALKGYLHRRSKPRHLEFTELTRLNSLFFFLHSLFPQIGTELLGQGLGLFFAPLCDLGVVARCQHLRNFATHPFGRAGVLGVFQKAI